MKYSILPPAFFDRPTLTVARELLGTWLVSDLGKDRRGRPQRRELMITEVEAYDGPRDRASHASRGLTPRTRVMFGPPGVFYIYFIYGMHWMANVVTGPAGYPAAVLLRAGAYRDSDRDQKAGAWVRVKGPGLLARHLGITGKENGTQASARSGLWFEARPRGLSLSKSGKIISSKRIGVDYAGPVWSARRYNFKLAFAEAPPRARPLKKA